MKTVFLHIGLHKTGSSALQLGLSNNKDLLLHHNILYPSAGSHYLWGQHNVAWQILGHPMYDGTKTGLADLIDEINYADSDNIVISSEVFSLFSRGHIATLQEALRPHNISIIVYLRNQADWLTSFWCEMAKGRQNSPDIPDLNSWLQNKMAEASVGDKYSPTPSVLGQYHYLCENWGDYFGKNNLIVINYDEIKKNGIFDSFLEIIGPNLKEAFVFPERVNEPVSFNTLNLIRLMRYYMRAASFSETSIESVKKILMLLPWFPGINKSARSNVKVSDQLTDTYSSCNREINCRYFIDHTGLPESF